MPEGHPTSNNCSDKYKLHKKQIWVISASDYFKYWWNQWIALKKNPVTVGSLISILKPKFKNHN